MVIPGDALLTAADYQRLTPEWPLGPRYQLVEGKLLQMPSTTLIHQQISGNLCAVLGNYLHSRQLGEMYSAPLDVYLDDHNVFQPDLLYVSHERAETLVPEGVRGAPDLVVEILLPSSVALDRKRKPGIYARLGTRELWLIDPDQRSLEVFALDRSADKPTAVYSVDADAAVVLETSLLPGLRIALAELFVSRLDRLK